jgi:hypothetical protein
MTLCSSCLLLGHECRLGTEVHRASVVVVACWSAAHSSSSMMVWRPHIIVELFVVPAEDALATKQPENDGEENERCDASDDSSSDCKREGRLAALL